MRETPTQVRAQERLKHIVMTAETLMLEQGFDAFKMNTLSQRAQVNIATIYRYFPNKTALAMGLLDDYLVQYRRLLAAQIKTAESSSIERVVDVLVEGYLDFFQSHPAFVAVWKGLQGTLAFKQKDIEDSRHNSCLLCESVGAFFPQIDHELMADAMFMVCEMTSNLMPTLLALEPHQASVFKHHMKQMITRYLSDIFDQQPDET